MTADVLLSDLLAMGLLLTLLAQQWLGTA